MSTHESTHQHAHGSGVYVKTLAALLLLTLITVAASYIDFGSGNVVIALLIASMKASLVALFFMHVYYSTRLTKMIVASGLFWLILLLFIKIGRAHV